MKIAVVGTGYVGLVAGTCFADTGNHVICVDINHAKIEKLKKGIPIIYEPGLDTLLKRNIDENRIEFTSDIKYAIEKCNVIFIAVGTPPGEDGSADLQYVLNVAKEIGTHMNSNKIIVNKSTVPVGTADLVLKELKVVLKSRNVEWEADVISNPEFLKEGAAIDDFMKPDRIIIGGKSEEALKTMSKLYSPFLRTNNRIYIMDNKSAELSKYAANAMLATKISFMNEIALLCDEVGADIDLVRVGIGSDTRIGHKFLFPGIGYGGSCFPKDVKALVHMGRQRKLPMRILESVEDVNAGQKRLLFDKMMKHYSETQETISGKTFAVWGLAFKPKTDDMREAPSIVMINLLLEAGARIVAYDPVAIDNAREIFGNKIEYRKDAYGALDNADALLIFTEWNDFRIPDFDEMRTRLKNQVIFDGRNMYNAKDMLQLGFDYYSVGRD
ncbi:MAG: UDP-glucose 6-dehydrogenase [Candidatus Margulisbacteria bacterium GWF2_35_9]|nr:MAG: UDP-glucose 6-dehydrogenase [Candidatus Margulisbacteria bacterium GWF2_35_9]